MHVSPVSPVSPDLLTGKTWTPLIWSEGVDSSKAKNHKNHPCIENRAY